MLVLRALLALHSLNSTSSARSARKIRTSFSVGLEALLFADQELSAGQNLQLILRVFADRSIAPAAREHFPARSRRAQGDASRTILRMTHPIDDAGL
jgi:hypothetical protein